MTPYSYSGHRAHGYEFDLQAGGPKKPGVRVHRPGHQGLWLGVDTVDDFCDELRAAARGAAINYQNRNRSGMWAA